MPLLKESRQRHPFVERTYVDSACNSDCVRDATPPNQPSEYDGLNAELGLERVVQAVIDRGVRTVLFVADVLHPTDRSPSRFP